MASTDTRTPLLIAIVAARSTGKTTLGNDIAGYLKENKNPGESGQ